VYTSEYLLYTALEALFNVGQSGYLVKVAMSSDEEIQGQSQLGEGSP